MGCWPRGRVETATNRWGSTPLVPSPGRWLGVPLPELGLARGMRHCLHDRPCLTCLHATPTTWRAPLQVAVPAAAHAACHAQVDKGLAVGDVPDVARAMPRCGVHPCRRRPMWHCPDATCPDRRRSNRRACDAMWHAPTGDVLCVMCMWCRVAFLDRRRCDCRACDAPHCGVSRIPQVVCLHVSLA